MPTTIPLFAPATWYKVVIRNLARELQSMSSLKSFKDFQIIENSSKLIIPHLH